MVSEPDRVIFVSLYNDQFFAEYISCPIIRIDLGLIRYQTYLYRDDV